MQTKQCIHLYELILMHGLLLDLLLNGLDVEGVGQGDPEGVPEDGVVLGRADPQLVGAHVRSLPQLHAGQPRPGRGGGDGQRGHHRPASTLYYD